MSKTAIVYASKYGCTATCVELLKQKLSGEVTTVDITKESVDISDYQTVVVGGSIYGGKIQSEITKFCETNKQQLLSKTIGLFICGAQTDKAKEQLEAVFDAELRTHAVETSYFGYEYNLEKMDFFSKLIIRMVAKATASESRINRENISKMADKLQQAS